jgi:acyl-CoA synthetase (AMP-forming)/AMP-acid ligase II
MNIYFPGTYAERTPDKPAIIMASSGQTVTYRQLEDRSNQLAQALYSFGLRRGDHIALLTENNERYHEVCWGAQRSGLYYTAINNHLTAEEIAYIINDCGARVLITSKPMEAAATELISLTPRVERRLAMGGSVPGYESYEEMVEAFPAERLKEESEGLGMLYSSGTTGRPKGVKGALGDEPFGSTNSIVDLELKLGFNENSVYLSPAPLYHAAPLVYTMSALRLGVTVIVMERFEAEEALRLIERYRATCGQFVPTMFVRMLKLPEEVRKSYDVSSMKMAIHAAAPCPVEVKQQMIEWWGPVIWEYYAGTEGNGMTFIGPQDWLAHPGSVGLPVIGEAHILDEEGNELPPGQPGIIWFNGGREFQYHNDPQKTLSSYNDKGWSTLWDIGYLDEKGYLYLTDRKSFMIISGGVNIYPQEVENVLVLHPKVADVAVIGVPHPEFGEEVKALVQPRNMAEAGPALEQELIDFCRRKLAHYKCPKSVDFEAELPRSPTGKLYKRLLRDRYWATPNKV